jgi:hypothetical protein
MIGNSQRCVFGYRIHLYDARRLGASTPCDGFAQIAGANNRFELFTRDAILLADANRLEAPGANIGAHGSNVKAETLRDLVKRVHTGFLVHRRKMP